MSLNHVALTVADRERSASFYAEYFGLTERILDEEHLLIVGSREGSVLALREGPPPGELPPSNHFGFQLANLDLVRAARVRLRDAGIAETEWEDGHDLARVQVTDPDGYRVELFAYAENPFAAGATRRDVEEWLAAYENAWRAAGTASLGELFTHNASYQMSPYEKPLAGLREISAMWEAEREGPHEPFTMNTALVALEDDTAVVRVEVAYECPTPHQYRDLWVIRLDADARCRSFEEWPYWPGQPLAPALDQADPGD